MTNNNQPITPPPELVHQWHKIACKDPYNGGTFFDSKVLKSIATQAARWGADQQLELDAKWLDTNALYTQNLTISPSGNALRKVMRPKPLTLKEQALAVIENSEICDHLSIEQADILRRALEALPS